MKRSPVQMNIGKWSKSTRRALLILLVGVLVAGVVGAVVLQQPTPNYSQFVSTDGTSLLYEGHILRLSGYTFYPALLGGAAAWHRPDFRSYIDHILDMGALAGQNLVRPTDFWDRTVTYQTWRDPTLWSNLDYLLQRAQQRGFFVVMDLSAYKWFLLSQGRDPYDARNWTTYLEAVGARYKTARSIAFYSISGEPTVPRTVAATQQLVTFYRTVTDTLWKADSGHHLITAGGFNHMEDELPQTLWWQEIDALPHNDIVAFKTYSLRDLNLIPTITAYARSLRKPVVDEEFGLPQFMGDAVYAGGANGYNGIHTSRAQFFQSVYRVGDEQGVAGFIFWNLGCPLPINGPQSYEVNPATPAVWQVIRAQAPSAPSSKLLRASAC